MCVSDGSDKICVFIEPITALVHDLLKRADQDKVLCLDHSNPPTKTNLQALTDGKYMYVVTTIEQLAKESVKKALPSKKIAALVVDEAHIPDKWRRIKTL